MKKILLSLMASALLITGCPKGGNLDSEHTSRENGESGVQNSQSSETSEASQPPQRNNHSLLDYDFSGIYCKLEVNPAAYDVESVLNYLMPGVDKDSAQMDNRNDSYSIEIDNIKHTWFYRENNMFSYLKDDHTPDLTMTEEDVLAFGDDFVKQMGFQVAENPEIVKLEDGNYSVCYTFQYEGVPILGNGSVNLKNGDEEDGFAYGEYIAIGVSGNGIFRVVLSHLYDVATVLEEYPAEKLIGKEQLESIINLAKTSLYNSLSKDIEYDYRLEGIELFYIPWKEKGKWVLLPAFRVSYVNLEDGEVVYTEQSDGTMGVVNGITIIDAVSGYVYR